MSTAIKTMSNEQLRELIAAFARVCDPCTMDGMLRGGDVAASELTGRTARRD